MNNIIEERKRLAMAATKEKLITETLDDFKELRENYMNMISNLIY